jgi:predicted HicB family RNase H-like nuclease
MKKPKTLIARGITGTYSWIPEEDIFYGTLDLEGDLVTFMGYTVEEVEAGFTEMVDEYYDLCEEVGKSPKIKKL